MPNFGRKRFDDRILDREDPGGAFERFVDEFLRLQYPNEALVLGLAKGRDGAIDLFDAGHKLTQVVECKFIGADTDGTAYKRWKAVKKHLRDNLPKAAKGSGAEKYRPWLKSEGDIGTYRFVTSAICADVNERNQLRQQIRAFFAAMSQEHDELSHLRDLNVDLRYWDDLVGQHATFTPLFYRWFGGFSKGYSEIALSFGSSDTGFKSFLASRNLPYFSRDAYDAQAGKQGTSQFETALDLLTTGNDGRAVVISGPGGVGKTRLSIELCEAARDRGWWPVRLERKARVADLDDLCKGHSDDAAVLLFIDYAEAFEDLDQLPEAMFRLARDGRHRISILASTRSSSIQRVTDRLTEIETIEWAFRNGAEQAGYHAWVVRQILYHFKMPDAEVIATSCSGLPVMAAFAALLYRRNRASFDEQFANLAAVGDFKAWATTRLKSVEDKFQGQPAQRILAELAVRLPMPMAEAEAFRASSDLYRDLFDVLKADHWIEPDGELFSTAHDVLADAMLARHLSGMPGGEQNRLQDLLFLALTENRLDRCLAAVDRLGQHPVFDQLSGRRAVEALMLRDRTKTLAQLPILAQSRLLTPADLIELLATSEYMRQRLAEAPQTHLSLARAAEWAATKGRDKIDRGSAETALTYPLQTAVAWPRTSRTSNMVLRCAHAFDNARYRKAVFERLARQPDHIDSRFLIVSLLKRETAIQEVLPLLQTWLTPNERAFNASFVYRSWLDATGDLELVRAHILAWLEDHAKKLEAQFVYKSWLDATGDLELVRAHILAWLEDHAKTLEARFVYRSWFKARKPFDCIRKYFEAWLKMYWHLGSAVYVTMALTMAEDLSWSSLGCIVAWAGTHPENEEAIFLLSRVSRHFNRHYIEFSFRVLLERSTAAVFSSLIRNRVLTESERSAISSLFVNLTKRKFARDIYWLNTLQRFCACLNHGEVLQHQHSAWAWTLLLHDALERRLLDPATDQTAITNALDLIREGMQPKAFSALLASGYLGLADKLASHLALKPAFEPTEPARR